MPDEMVVLVDEADREIGTGEKLAVHQAGSLHRAFSIFVYDAEGRVILQRRAAGKYHSAGRWSNTCCGHPRPGESVLDAAHRRLREEMGFDCPLQPEFTFTYRAILDSGLIEHELDHVLTGSFAEPPRPDPTEVSAWRAVPVDTLLAELAENPHHFSAWLPPAAEKLFSHNAGRRTGGRG